MKTQKWDAGKKMVTGLDYKLQVVAPGYYSAVVLGLEILCQRKEQVIPRGTQSHSVFLECPQLAKPQRLAGLQKR